MSSFRLLLCLMVIASSLKTINSYTTAEPVDYGDCACHVNAPSSIHCSAVAAVETKITDKENEINHLSVQLDNHVTHYEEQSITITELTETLLATLDTLEKIDDGSLVATHAEITQIRKEVEDTAALLEVLQHNYTTASTINTIQTEFVEIANLLEVLENENADTSELLQQINDLKAQLEDAARLDSTDLLEIWDQEGTQDSCLNIQSVSLPYTVRGFLGTYGAWFRDPFKNSKQVYYAPMANTRYFYYLYSYNTLKDFYDGVSAHSSYAVSNTYTAQGTGLVAFNGSVYYNTYNTRNVARYDLTSRTIKALKALGSAGYNNVYPYRSGLYSDIDLLTDETSLYAIYSTTSASGMIVISKLNPETLDIIQTWQTNFPKNAAGNCFIVCGVVYCTNGYDSHIARIIYKYDTKTSSEGFVSIPFDNKYKLTTALNYNPRDQKLYGYDNGHTMIYELRFEE